MDEGLWLGVPALTDFVGEELPYLLRGIVFT